MRIKIVSAAYTIFTTFFSHNFFSRLFFLLWWLLPCWFCPDWKTRLKLPIGTLTKNMFKYIFKEDKIFWASQNHYWNFDFFPMVVGLLCVYNNNVKVFCISLEVRSIDELMMKYYCWIESAKRRFVKIPKSLPKTWSLLFMDLVLIQLWCLEVCQEISSSEHFC